MDKEHAKFILKSYRPDGADAHDMDFAEALHLAAEDRELGAWLAHERAQDSFFVEALSAVNIPEGLRDEILAVMEYDGGGEAGSEIDALFVGAMAHVLPPEGFKEQIISAMEVERESVNRYAHSSAERHDGASNKMVKFPMWWLNLAAIAAVLILAATFLFYGGSNSESDLARQLNLAEFQMGSGKILSVSNEVDVSDDSIEAINTWLEAKGMPVADAIPKGLISFDVKGGRKLTLDNGIEASMIYFKKEDAGDFYLMVLKADSLEDADSLKSISQVKLQKCKNCPITHFNISGWRDETKAYLLLTKSESEVMANLFY